MSAPDFDWFADRLDPAVVKSDTPGARDWMTRCPVHDGSDSLHIEEKRGRVLVHCFNGDCEASEKGKGLPLVVRALEAEEGDATPPRVIRRRRDAGDPMAWWVEYTGVDEATWRDLGVQTEGGAVAFTFGDLDARKLRAKPSGEKKAIEWRGRLRPLLWPLPGAVVEKEVHLSVSESDCGALIASGFNAYSLTKGDSGTAELFRALKVLKDRGAERVVVWTDADSSGRRAREDIVTAVQSVGLTAIYPDMDSLADPISGEKDVNDVFRRLGPQALADAALAALVDVPEPTRTLTHEEMIAAAAVQIDWRIPDLLGPGDKVGLIGPYKSRKTFVLADLARALATGAPFLGVPTWSVPRPFRVLVVEEEGSRQRFGLRVAALTEIPPDTDLIRWKHRSGFDFTSEARVAALIDEMREHGTDVVLFDPFQRMSGDGEENSATAMKPAWDAVARMQAALPDLVVVIVFHTRKDDSLSLDAIRGSGRHAGEIDLALMVKKDDHEHSLLTVEGRDVPASDGEAMRVKFDYEPGVRLLVSVVGMQAIRYTKVKAADRRAQVLDLFQAAGTDLALPDVMSALKLGDRTARGYIADLVRTGDLDALSINGTKTWRAPASGNGNGLKPVLPVPASGNATGIASSLPAVLPATLPATTKEES